jgi:hypothetical protein
VIGSAATALQGKPQPRSGLTIPPGAANSGFCGNITGCAKMILAQVATWDLFYDVQWEFI